MGKFTQITNWSAHTVKKVFAQIKYVFFSLNSCEGYSVII